MVDGHYISWAGAHRYDLDGSPPFHVTKTILPIYNDQGGEVQPEIHARTGNGFFKANQDWTCYRSGYFSVACWYTLEPWCDLTSVSLSIRQDNHLKPVQSLALCLFAKVNGEDGREIDLVQHRPKRDRGPTASPQKVELMPVSVPAASGVLGPSHRTTAKGVTQSSAQYEHVSSCANFDRIKFKYATANNGEKNAIQKYFHLVVGLYVHVNSGNTFEDAWIQVATCMSAPLVVRGRSPGFYVSIKMNKKLI